MPSLNVTFTGNSAPLLAEIAKVRGGIRANLQKDLAVWAATGATPDPSKLFKDGQKAGTGWFSGFLAKMQGTGSGSMSQLISVVSNTLSSLGSGINPARILMQQGPNVAQALVTMSDDVFGIIQRYLINPITGAIAGALIGAFAAWRFSASLISHLSGMKMPEIKLEYVSSYLQKITQALNIHEAINRAITKASDSYFSVARAAEMIANSTKEQFDHQRRMNELSSASPEEKARKAASIDAAERKATLDNKQKEYEALLNESKQKEAQAVKLSRTVSSAEIDKQRIDATKQVADAAKARAQQYGDSKAPFMADWGPFKATSKRDLLEAYNTVSASGVSREDIAKAEVDAKAKQKDSEKAYKDAVNLASANEIVRKRVDELKSQAEISKGKATTLGLELPELRKIADSKDANANAELQARLANMPDPKQTLSSNQQIGAYAGSYQPTMLTETKKIQQHVKTTAEILTSLQHKLMPGDNVDNHF